MRDDDRLLDVPHPEFGSGVIGVCDICGVRQAVVVLTKERYRLCVIDFLNKTWLKSEKKPSAPAPVYRSERIWFDSSAVPEGKAPGIVLSPTRPIRHPVVLITPDVYGITTTLLDAAIRLAREGFEVLLPDLGKTSGVGASTHLALRAGARFRGGVPIGSGRVQHLLRLYGDALDHLLQRDMVDPSKVGLFGTSYGGSLALALAGGNTRLTAVAVAYPVPLRPHDAGRLLSAPTFVVRGSSDRLAARATSELLGSVPNASSLLTLSEIPSARHDFLARDVRAYDLPGAERAWSEIVGFLKSRLMPPPPRPPPPPVKPAAPGPASSPTPAVGPVRPPPLGSGSINPTPG